MLKIILKTQKPELVDPKYPKQSQPKSKLTQKARK